MSTSASTNVTGWIAASVAILCMGLPPAHAGDVDTAKLFLETAQEKVRGRKYDEALVLLQKATSEDAFVLEVYWLEGQVREKLKSPGAALTAYRRFLELYDQKAQRGLLEDDESKLKKKVEKRVDILAAGERALQACEEDYISALVAFAEKHAQDAPSVSMRALDLVLELQRGHARATQLYEELSGAPPEDCQGETLGRTPFDRWTYSSTTDLIEDEAFSSGKIVSYTDGMQKVKSDPEGYVITTSKAVAVSPQFVYHASFRVTALNSTNWLVGLLVGISGGGISKFVTSSVQPDRLVVVDVDQSKGEKKEVADHRIPLVKSGTWHDLLVHVNGQKIVVYFDGKKAANYVAPRGCDLMGGIGLHQQGCEVDFRALRIGRVE